MGRLGFPGKKSLLQTLKPWKNAATDDLDSDTDGYWSPRGDTGANARAFNAKTATFTPTQKRPRPSQRHLSQDTTNSDHETDTGSVQSGESGTTGAPSVAPSTRLDAVFSAGRKLLKQRSLARANSTDFCESDFAPIPIDSAVYTRFGLGTVWDHRDDGVMVIRLQNAPDGALLFLGPQDDDCFVVPALLHDWVHTPVGDGRVMAFNARTQVFAVRISGDLEFLAHVHSRHVRRAQITRRTTFSGYGYHRKRAPRITTPASTSHVPQVLQKGFSSAFQKIKTKSTGFSTTTQHFVSNVYYHNQCVLTSFGEGSIISIDHTHERVQVQLACGATAYLSMDAVQYFVKAHVGMEVSTKYGLGTVEAVRPDDEIYTVRLYAPRKGENDVVFVHASDLTKSRKVRLTNVQRDMQDRLARAKKNKFVAYAQRKAKFFGSRSSSRSSMDLDSRAQMDRGLSLGEDYDFDVEPITAGI